MISSREIFHEIITPHYRAGHYPVEYPAICGHDQIVHRRPITVGLADYPAVSGHLRTWEPDIRRTCRPPGCDLSIWTT